MTEKSDLPDFVMTLSVHGMNVPKEWLDWSPVHPALGFLPCFFDNADPDDAVAQVDKNYAHGGGWFDIENFVLGCVTRADGTTRWVLDYPGDPSLYGVSEAVLHDKERIVVFDYGFIAVMPVDDMTQFRVARLD